MSCARGAKALGEASSRRRPAASRVTNAGRHPAQSRWSEQSRPDARRDARVFVVRRRLIERAAQRGALGVGRRRVIEPIDAAKRAQSRRERPFTVSTNR